MRRLPVAGSTGSQRSRAWLSWLPSTRTSRTSACSSACSRRNVKPRPSRPGISTLRSPTWTIVRTPWSAVDATMRAAQVAFPCQPPATTSLADPGTHGVRVLSQFAPSRLLGDSGAGGPSPPPVRRLAGGGSPVPPTIASRCSVMWGLIATLFGRSTSRPSPWRARAPHGVTWSGSHWHRRGLRPRCRRRRP